MVIDRLMRDADLGADHRGQVGQSLLLIFCSVTHGVQRWFHRLGEIVNLFPGSLEHFDVLHQQTVEFINQYFHLAGIHSFYLRTLPTAYGLQ